MSKTIEERVKRTELALLALMSRAKGHLRSQDAKIIDDAHAEITEEHRVADSVSTSPIAERN
jgi:hypothetical protein